ncbi:MAG: hypothetical protein ACOC4G_01685 [Bacillota bacterium]
MKSRINQNFFEKKLILYLLNNPFIWGIIAGIVSRNLSLGLIASGFTMLLWGWDRYSKYLVLFTTILVFLTGNVNFEIIFLYFVSLYYIIKKNHNFNEVSEDIIGVIAGVISLAFFPVWKIILGNIPVQILNDINISGELLLLAGIILSTRRGIRLIKKKSNEVEIIQYLLMFIMAVTGMYGNWWAIPVWISGILLSYQMELQDSKVIFSLSPLKILILLLVLSLTAGYFLLPLNILFLTVLIISGSIIYINKKRISLIEMVYLCFLLGLIAGRLNLIH